MPAERLQALCIWMELVDSCSAAEAPVSSVNSFGFSWPRAVSPQKPR
jgi:hypothetical protein